MRIIMATYIYTRFSPKNRAYAEHLELLQSAAAESEHIEDKVRGNVQPLERPGFKLLLKKVKPGDTLYIWWLTVFGRDFSQARNTLEALLDKGLTIKTLCEPLTLQSGCTHTQSMLSLLSGYAKVQIQHRLFAAELGREELKGDPERWKEKFRGRPADKQKHQQIKSLLLEGETMQSVATACDVSLSTVKRVKAKLNKLDQEGCLRRRGHHGDPSGEV